MATIAAPTEFRVTNKHRLLRADSIDTSDSTLDPRGIIYLFEPPNPRAKYVMGVDATQGRTGWNRYNRTEDDNQIDNGAIEVYRIGRAEPDAPNFIPHTQVAEYAAPNDPYELAAIANVLGRLYGGRHEEGQALCIIEVYPGPGGPCQRTMMEEYGYTNMYRWQYLDTGTTAERSKFDFGWYSSKQSMVHLWTRGLRAIHRKQVLFKSSVLVEEFADCEMDLVRMRGEAVGGSHDDRVMASLLAIWVANNWSFNIEPQPSHVHTGPVIEYQATDISSERMLDAWNERFEEISLEISREYADD